MPRGGRQTRHHAGPDMDEPEAAPSSPSECEEEPIGVQVLERQNGSRRVAGSRSSFYRPTASAPSELDESFSPAPRTSKSTVTQLEAFLDEDGNTYGIGNIKTKTGHIEGVKKLDENNTQDHLAALENRRILTRHLISDFFLEDLGVFLADNLSTLQSLVKVGRRHRPTDLEFFLNQSHQIFLRAVRQGLKTELSRRQWLMCSWLAMAGCEVAANLKSQKQFYQRFRDDEKRERLIEQQMELTDSIASSSSEDEEDGDTDYETSSSEEVRREIRRQQAETAELTADVEETDAMNAEANYSAAQNGVDVGADQQEEAGDDVKSKRNDQQENDEDDSSDGNNQDDSTGGSRIVVTAKTTNSPSTVAAQEEPHQAVIRAPKTVAQLVNEPPPGAAVTTSSSDHFNKNNENVLKNGDRIKNEAASAEKSDADIGNEVPNDRPAKATSAANAVEQKQQDANKKVPLPTVAQLREVITRRHQVQGLVSDTAATTVTAGQPRVYKENGWVPRWSPSPLLAPLARLDLIPGIAYDKLHEQNSKWLNTYGEKQCFSWMEDGFSVKDRVETVKKIYAKLYTRIHELHRSYRQMLASSNASNDASSGAEDVRLFQKQLEKNTVVHCLLRSLIWNQMAVYHVAKVLQKCNDLPRFE
ncbi:unnamed protein product [Amoebophrya sp. A120]|nr:unnamed protein product [Amoebophrya sp. A120]|eukprot:GSA120T00021395001.1